MGKFFRHLLNEIYINYYQYLFVHNNRKKLLKLVLYVLIGFGVWLTGYKWRDATIIVQNLQIRELSAKKQALKSSISDLEESLGAYNFMLADGDYYRYLAFKHGDVNIPKSVNAKHLRLLTEQAKKYEIPFRYIYRQVWKESGYKSAVVSPMGARSYMQIIPSTFKSMVAMYKNDTDEELDIENFKYEEQNIIIGCYTVNYLWKRYGDWNKVFAAYNAGTEPVDRAGGVPNYPETQAYVKFIINK